MSASQSWRPTGLKLMLSRWQTEQPSPQRTSLTLQQPELQPIQQQLLYCLTCPWRPAAAKERPQLHLMAEEKSVSPGAGLSVGMTVSVHLPSCTEMKEVHTLPLEIQYLFHTVQPKRSKSSLSSNWQSFYGTSWIEIHSKDRIKGSWLSGKTTLWDTKVHYQERKDNHPFLELWLCYLSLQAK